MENINLEYKKFLNINLIKKLLKHLYNLLLYIMSKTKKCKKTKQEWKGYQLGETYEITTTFSDEWQCIKSCNAQNPKQRLIAFNKFLQCTYFDLFKYCSYTLYVELSDPQEWDKYGGKYPRFHLHGTITMPDAVEELLYFKLNTPSLISQYGRVQINNLRPDWKDYCTKDQELYGTWLKCYNSMDKLISKSKVKKPKEPYDFFKPV